MKRLVKTIIVVLVAASLLTGCISFKEFTDEELELLSAAPASLEMVG